MLYFAYGSNLNKAAMKVRCPRAMAIGKLTLRDARLVFRGVADCAYEPGASCPGGLWRITPECEDALDRYEGVSGGLYVKEYFNIPELPGNPECLVYTMRSTGIFPPSEGYLETIKRGYHDFKLPLSALKKAVKDSWDDKAPTNWERRRYHQKNEPRLARSF